MMNSLKQVEANDQATQTILLGLPEEIYAAVDSLFHPDQPSLSTYMQQPQPNNNYNPQPSFNQNYMQQSMPNSEDITDPTTAMNMTLVLKAKAFKLNYSTLTNNYQRISLNPRNRQIAQPGVNMGQDKKMQMVGGNGGNQFRQYAGQNVENQNGSKDEAPEVIKTFLKKIQVLLQASVIIVRTDNETEFKNQVLQEYFNSVGISHQASYVRTPQQNGVVERKNCMLVEAARTMLIFSRAPLFLWAEVIATACYTQNRSIIHHRFDKTPYELINGRKPDISFLYSLQPKGKKIMETMNVIFDELSTMAFEQNSLKPKLQSLNSKQISSGLDLTYASSTITTQQPTERELDLQFEAMYDDYIGGQPSAAPRTTSAAQAPQVFQTATTSTTIADTAVTPTNSSSQATNFPNTS
nr:hypothetical protein [Tanacetum cinerariifolium]